MKFVLILIIKTLLLTIIIPLVYNFFMIPFISLRKIELPTFIDFLFGVILKISALILHVFLGAVLYSLYHEITKNLDSNYITKGLIYIGFLILIVSILNNFFTEQRINNEKLSKGIEVPGGNIFNWTIKYLVLILVSFIVFTIWPNLAKIAFNDYHHFYTQLFS